jgi:hypothetical protein
VSPVTGYAHPDFARVYAYMGEPVSLVASGGTLLRRKIAGTSLSDLTGCYPFFCCADWSALGDDLAAIGKDDVSVVLVADPFADDRAEQLEQDFGFARPFKTHYVADLSRPLASFIPSERMREARSAARRLDVEVAPSPAGLVGDWLALWDRSRHAQDSSGENRLSREAAERLFSLPGVTVLCAIDRERTVGMHVEVQQGDIVHGHFATYDPEYYRFGVSTLLTVFELEHFASRARFYNHGGVPGTRDGQNGLSRFKRDFSNTTRMAFLCGSVFDSAAYDRLAGHKAASQPGFFPAYRAFDQAGKACHDTPE